MTDTRQVNPAKAYAETRGLSAKDRPETTKENLAWYAKVQAERKQAAKAK